MKRCPECKRDYYDETLLYCLDDGTALLEGRSSMNEPATAIFRSTDPRGGDDSVMPIATSQRTEILPGATALRSKNIKLSSTRLVSIVVAVLVLGGLGFFFGYRYFARDDRIDSIAVLPLQNNSGNPDSEYLSDGLAESLIYRLSQLPDLKVSPASSVMRYKGKEFDAQKIAAELGVQAVMSGRMVQRGDNLSISVELIDAVNNKTIWGEQFERKMADLLATQREIAAVITEKLQLQLSRDEIKGVTKRYTDSNEAYQAYLKGRYYWNRRDAENITKATEQFRIASEKDPNFALAYVGLADCLTVSSEYLGTSSKENLPKAMAYANRALEIDDSLAEVHATLGLIHENSWNWAAAEAEFKKAIELNPNYPMALHWYSLALRFKGRPHEGLVYIKRAQELDPLSIIVSANVVETYLALGDVDSAYDQAKRLIELEPNNWGPHNRLGLVYLKQGNHAAALSEAEKAVELSKRSSFTLGHYGYLLGISGNRQAALEIARELEERYSIRRHGGRDIAVIYAGIGDRDRAFEWLEKDFRERSSDLVQLKSHFGTEPLRNDPRFTDLLRRMGLPE